MLELPRYYEPISWHQNPFTRAFITAFCLTVIFFSNPFGMRTATVKYSEDLYISLLSPWYKDKGESEVAIVLLDDAFIQNYQGQYPVSYSKLTQLLRVISTFEPQAVFFDILQIYKHSEHFDRWVKRLAGVDFPVYMASIPSIDTPQELARSDSLRHDLYDVSKFSAVGWKGNQHYYPLRLNPEDKKQDTEIDEKGISRTVALDLYMEWCRKKQELCQNSTEDLLDTRFFHEPMVVQWSSKAADQQEKYLNLSEHCQEITDDRFAFLLNSIISHCDHGLTDFISRAEKVRSTCFHLLSVSALSLFQPGARSSVDLKNALQDKIILVGYNLSGSSDIVVSPVHGTMPGLFYHAMALDNLINFGNDYWHAPKVLLGGISISDISEGLLQGIMLWLVFFYRYWHVSEYSNILHFEYQSYAKRRFQLLFVLTGCAICFSTGVILYNHLGPINWFALLAIVGMALPTFAIQKLRLLKEYH